MTEAMMEALRAEFSDVSDPAQLTRIVIRLLLAAALGAVLGYERERRGKAAGLRTHMLVAIGAALFVLVPQQGGMAVADMSRVIQGIVTGVGFLGAGSIMRSASEDSIRGLTTAASIWLAAASGIACGLANWPLVIVGCGLGLLVLVITPVERVIHNRRKTDPKDLPERPERPLSPDA
jgi:putative Mg2+ transporter-C (MgtC) family protein